MYKNEGNKITIKVAKLFGVVAGAFILSLLLIPTEAIFPQGDADHVALQAIQKWNGVLPVRTNSNSTVPFINLTK